MTDYFNEYVKLDDRAKDGEPQNVAEPNTGWTAAGWWTGDMWAAVYPEGVDTVCQLDFEPTHFKPKA